MLGAIGEATTGERLAAEGADWTVGNTGVVDGGAAGDGAAAGADAGAVGCGGVAASGFGGAGRDALGEDAGRFRGVLLGVVRIFGASPWAGRGGVTRRRTGLEALRDGEAASGAEAAIGVGAGGGGAEGGVGGRPVRATGF